MNYNKVMFAGLMLLILAFVILWLTAITTKAAGPTLYFPLIATSPGSGTGAGVSMLNPEPFAPLCDLGGYAEHRLVCP